MKKLFSLSIFIMLFTLGFAQKPEITFKSKSYDFGKIKEENGPASTTFEFTNTGVAPLVINGVTASCGCTTPEWTKEPIPAGGKGVIKATYNATGRPGSFKKSITVRSNASEETVVLNIGGEVIPRPKSVEEEYPVKVGDLRLKSKSSPLFDIYKDESRTDRMLVKNTSKSDVKISFANVPKHIVLEATPAVVKPNSEATIVITYNSKNVNDYGNRTDFAYLVLNGKQVLTDDYKITVNSNIREDFRKLTDEQKASAPVAEYQSKSLSVDLKKGEKKTVVIALKNTGKQPLLIRKIKVDKGISKVSCKGSIAPGKSANVKVDLNAAKVTADGQSKFIIITNDPKNPTTVIPVSVKVAK